MNQLTTTALFLSGLVACRAPQKSTQLTDQAGESTPDYVLILLDTAKSDILRITDGNGSPAMPQLLEFAEKSLVFTAAESSSSWTLPSVASIMTGKYPWEHHVVKVRDEPRSYGKLPPDPSLAPRLRDEGYTTLAVITNPFLSSSFGFHQGFDDYDFEMEPNNPAGYRNSAQVVALAKEQLDHAEIEKPVFQVIHFFDLHPPYNPPSTACKQRFIPSNLDSTFTAPILEDNYLRLNDPDFHPTLSDIQQVGGNYAAAACDLDVSLGDFFDSLDARKEATQRNMVVILVGDHGEELWEYGRFGHGHDLHEKVTGVPLVIQDSRSTKHGYENELVNTKDIYGYLTNDQETRITLAVRGEKLSPTIIFAGDANHKDVVSARNNTHRLIFDTSERIGALWLFTDNQVLMSSGLTEAQLKSNDASVVLLDALKEEGAMVGLNPPQSYDPKNPSIFTIETRQQQIDLLGFVREPEAVLQDQLKALGYIE